MRLLFVVIFAIAVASGNPVSGENISKSDPQGAPRYQVIIGIRPFTGEKFPGDENKTILVIPSDGIIWVDGQRFAISTDNANRSDARLVIVNGRRHHRPTHNWPHRPRPFGPPQEHPGPGHGFPSFPPRPPYGRHPGGRWYPPPGPPQRYPPQFGFTGQGEIPQGENSKKPDTLGPSTEFPEDSTKYHIIDLRS